MAECLKNAEPREFLLTGGHKSFLAVLKKYSVAIKLINDYGNKRVNVEQLDKWYQEELLCILKSRGSKLFLLHDELVKLMQWKLARGKFRPLLKLVAGNSEEQVKQCTMEGMSLAAKNISGALSHITRLKGVGPATASAVLAAAAPDHCAFFADEVALAVLGMTRKLKYTEAEYLQVNTELLQCAARLNKLQQEEQCDEKKWGAHNVELALWTYVVLHQHKPDLLRSVLANTGGSSVGVDSRDSSAKKRSSAAAEVKAKTKKLKFS